MSAISIRSCLLRDDSEQAVYLFLFCVKERCCFNFISDITFVTN